LTLEVGDELKVSVEDFGAACGLDGGQGLQQIVQIASYVFQIAFQVITPGCPRPGGLNTGQVAVS